ncbi:GRAM domain protein [Aphelenchoides bicaudatus]|nr:GRAM domain protein [Aphelenchoides bicaudatus]
MVWIKPDHLLVSQPFWTDEQSNLFFALQKRKGHGNGLASLFVATIDNVFDTKPAPYRILYHYAADDLNISIVIAIATTMQEISNHWDYLEKNILPVLGSFESEEEARQYVLSKVEGLIRVSETAKNLSAQQSSAEVTRAAILQKFHKIFELPPDEKLVNYYAGTYWQGRRPIQGRLYFSVNFLCFYSFIVGKQTKFQIRWTEITKLDKNEPLLFPQTIKVWTRNDSYEFSLISNFREAYKLASQLTNLAMKHKCGMCLSICISQRLSRRACLGSIGSTSTSITNDLTQNADWDKVYNQNHQANESKIQELVQGFAGAVFGTLR